MTELFLLVFSISVVLGIVAVVGHGLWLAFAWFIRLLFGRGPNLAGGPLWKCPRCYAALAARDTVCARCGWPRVSAETAGGPLADLKATARQIERFRESGAITPVAYERVMQAIAAEEHRLTAALRTGPSQPTTAAPSMPILLPPAAATLPVTTGSFPVAAPASNDSLAELFPPLPQAGATTTPPIAPAPPFAVPVEPISDYALAPPSQPTAAVPPSERVHAVMDRMKAAETIQP